MLGFSEWSWSIAASLPPYDGRLDAGAVVGELEGDGKTPYQRGEHTYDDGLAKMPPARPLPWAALLHRMHASVSTASSQMLAFGRPAGVRPARDRLRRRSRIRRGPALAERSTLRSPLAQIAQTESVLTPAMVRQSRVPCSASMATRSSMSGWEGRLRLYAPRLLR